MVGGDTAADQAEGGGEAVEEVDLGVDLLVFEDVLGRVEAGGAGADDRDAKRVLRGSDLAQFLIPCQWVGIREPGRIGNRRPQACALGTERAIAGPVAARSAIGGTAGAGTIVEMKRPATTSLIALSLVGAALLCAAPASASSRVVFSADRWIDSIPPAGGHATGIARAPRKTADLAATEDGSWIAALSNRGAPGPSPGHGNTDHLRQIFLIGPRGGRRPLFPAPLRTSANDSIAISPDGGLIAFGRDNEIWVLRRNGTHMRQVTSGNQGAALDPAFLPDGRTLVFSRYIGLSRAQLFTVSVSGGVERPIPAAGTWALAATVSPSGLIAYLGHGPHTPWQLRTIRADGSDRRSIYRPHGGAAMYTPDFSPDGSRIVLVSGRGARWDERRYSLVTVAATGGHLRTLVAGGGDHHMSPQWTRSP